MTRHRPIYECKACVKHKCSVRVPIEIDQPPELCIYGIYDSCWIRKNKKE